MYLHAGNGRNIRISSIIGIFDADTATVSAVTKKFINKYQSDRLIDFASYELPKSMILYRENGVNKICFSQLAVGALTGRIENKGHL